MGSIISFTTTDPAGSVYAMQEAVNRYVSDWTYRAISTVHIGFMNYPYDIFLPDYVGIRGLDEVMYLIENADVIILQKPQELEWLNFSFSVDRQGGFPSSKVDIKDYLKGKIVAFQHHGEPSLRMNPNDVRSAYTGKEKVMVVTPDLLKFLPFAKYMPNCIITEDTTYQNRYDSLALRNPNPMMGNAVVIGHSPTPTEYGDVDIKDTKYLEEIIKRLHGKYPHISMMKVEGVNNRKCIQLKKMNQLGFDHMQGYYGKNALEYAAVKVPCFVGLDELNLKHINTFFSTDGKQDLPFLVTTRETFESDMVKIANDEDMRKEMSRRVYKSMTHVWTPKFIATKFVEFLIS